MKKIAVMGHIDHGKTTLVSAISRIFDGEKRNVSEDPEMVLRTEAEIEFGAESYLLFDYPADEDYEENLDGTEDGAVLVVASTDGPMSGTEKAVRICKKLGIKITAVFMSLFDLLDDEELVELVEMDVQDLLSENGFDPEVPFIRGSAKMAEMGYSGWENKIAELVEAATESI